MRPHHGICIQLFRGKGYSDEFVSNMKNVIKNLENNPIIVLNIECDEICTGCPNQTTNNRCESDDKVYTYDNNVLKQLGLENGTQIHWQEFSKRIQKEILDSDKLDSICKDCTWLEFCKKVIVGLSPLK